LLSVNAQSRSDTLYQITDLGTLGGATTVANYINNRGEIVGTSRTAVGFQHAFLYRDGIMEDLGTLGGNESAANIINDRGEIGGAADDPTRARHGFLYDRGTMSDLGALPGSTFSTVFGLNNRGELVGGSQLPGTSVFHAVAFSAGGVTDLGTLGGPSSFAVHISDAGEATGRADLPTGLSRAFLYTGGVLYNIGVLPGDTVSFGRSLNNRGDVVAQSCGSSGCRAFLWREGDTTELGSLGGTQTNPVSINNRAQIVGASRTATSGAMSHAFLWENGVMVDLNDRIPPGDGWVLLQANAVNASGEIVGNGTLNGQARGFLLVRQPRRLP
jgi:probable HAF family extracellular repeat protein